MNPNELKNILDHEDEIREEAIRVAFTWLDEEHLKDHRPYRTTEEAIDLIMNKIKGI